MSYKANDKRAEKAVRLIESFIADDFKFSPTIRDYAVGTIQGYLNEAWSAALSTKSATDRSARLEDALREIMNLSDVEADQCGAIARRALRTEST